MSKRNLILLLLILSSLLKGYSQDIALHKLYTLSCTPNYPYSAQATDKTSLTDGIYTSPGSFWTKPTTVGWEHRQVTITIDLGTVYPISSVTFNTARSTQSEVFFPQAIYIFLSRDNKNYIYAGDAANASNNVPGDYKVQKFLLSNINENARYVKITVIPNEWFIFCDEIEVLKGHILNSQNAKIKIPEQHLEYTVDSLSQSFSVSEEALAQLVINRDDPGSVVFGINQESIQSLSRGVDNYNSPKNLNTLKYRIGMEYASALSKTFNTPFVVEKCNPWTISLNELHKPLSNLKSLQYHFFIPTEDDQYGAFIITNTGKVPQKLSFKIENHNSSVNTFELYKVPFVGTANHIQVPDPLIPVKSGVSLDPGFCEMFLFKLKGMGEGENTLEIKIETSIKSVDLKIQAEVKNLFGNRNCTLNTDNWAYLYYPMLQDRRAEAASDLHAHHINTVVIPPLYLSHIGADNFNPLVEYLSLFKGTGIKNILLFKDFSSDENKMDVNGDKFPSSGWKHEFISWYQNIVPLIRNNGFPNANIYFYPYDEVRDKDINDFKELIQWSKEAIPGIKFFATLTDKNNITNILPLVDVAQILGEYPALDDLPPHHANVWIYKVKGTARSLNPYTYYRLMAWEAFLKGYSGIGFWDYADENSGMRLNLINSPNVNPVENYSVIYDGLNNSIISSRRWEAFSLGIEDYHLLCQYANKYGLNKTKKMAKQVLLNPNNMNEADSIRNILINSL